MGTLSHDDILELRAAAIAACLSGSREALLSGINKDLVATLKIVATPGEQILRDLEALNDAEQLDDGSIPLQTWLTNAEVLVGARKEASVFQRILRRSRANQPVNSAERRSVRPADGTQRRNQSWLLMLVVLLAVGAALLSAYLIRKPDDIVATNDTLPCPAGRQRYEGLCVADRLIDFMVCLKVNNALVALRVTEASLRDTGSSMRSSDKDDMMASRRVTEGLSRLSPEELLVVHEKCWEVAKAAQITLKELSFTPISRASAIPHAVLPVSPPAAPPHVHASATATSSALPPDPTSAPKPSASNSSSPSPGIPEMICVARGDVCNAKSDCCAGDCIRGRCNQCIQADAKCNEDAECCGGLKCLGHKCAAGCKGYWASCSSSTECCNGTCLLGNCR